jgi:hypothetical protein
MAALDRWNDGRLDDLKDRVDSMAPTVGTIASLRVELRAVTVAVGKFSEQFEQAKQEPIRRWRRLRDLLIVAVVSATLSGAFVVAGALIAGAH